MIELILEIRVIFQQTRWKIYKTIEDVILPLLPSQGEDKVIDEGVLALWKEDKKYRSGEPGPFDVNILLLL